MTGRFTYEAVDETGTDALGAKLADLLPAGCVVALTGTLGAGKTRLVQAMARASGVEPRDVVSPTFVLVHEYRGRRPLFHFDAYRLRDEDEFLDLGPDEYFEGDGITLIEWADRVAGALPGDRVEIRLTVTGETSRRFEIRSTSDRHAPVIEQLEAWARSGPEKPSDDRRPPAE